ncbi:MAG: VWA domain-containing protein [Gammaproteobacteria bacterium]|nr:VWA domain-containing protein [Gammaproteobacteria bacterium]
MAKRRSLSVFSLSFLDVMSCGFGAVVLIFLIINHATEEDAKIVNKDRLAEIRLLDYQVQNGERDLFELQEQLEGVLQRLGESRQKRVSTEADLEQVRRDFDDLDAESSAERASVERLKSDLEAREEEVARLRQIEEANDGGRALAFVGEGDRQYLTGLKVGGSNVVIAVDASASMLDRTIVNVLRRRNMPEQRRRQAPKWRRAVRTVEWLAAQLPLDADFQVFAFNEQTRSLVAGSGDQWTPLGDGSALAAAIGELDGMVPSGGTSLLQLATKLRALDPLPDNVYLVTDSLPTQGTRAPRRATISGADRLDLFRDALRQMPLQVPINVILFPMEGDPLASAAYWNLARTSGGAYMAPARDWP